ncbi:VanZ family protein [Candidatus Fermentibacterales bacterium]|nr:VanZ family protein [Candidatus Fermentibacterales bacterium]
MGGDEASGVRPRLLVRRGILFLAAMGIFFLSHQPSLPSVPLFPMQDKLFHLVEFLIFGLLLCWNDDIFRGRRVLSVALAGFAWALLDEIHQAYVPGRDCDVTDLAADWSGVLLAVLIVFRSRARRESRRARRG